MIGINNGINNGTKTAIDKGDTRPPIPASAAEVQREAPRLPRRIALAYYVCSSRAEAQSVEAELRACAKSRGYRILGAYFDKRGRAPSTLLGLIDICSRMSRKTDRRTNGARSGAGSGLRLLIPSREHITACGANVQAMLHHAAKRGIRFVFADEAEAAEQDDALALACLGFVEEYHGFGGSGAQRCAESASSSDSEAASCCDAAEGRLPFGYACIDGRPTADAPAAEAVREAFALFALGMSISSIERTVRSDFPTLDFPSRSQLYAMIANERYIGLDRGGRDQLPAIVENALWLAVRNSEMRRGLSGGEHVFLFKSVPLHGMGVLLPSRYSRLVHAPAYCASIGSMLVCADAVALDGAAKEAIAEAIKKSGRALRRRCLELIAQRERFEKLCEKTEKRMNELREEAERRFAGAAKPTAESSVRELDELVSRLRLAEQEHIYARELKQRLSIGEGEVHSFFDHLERFKELCAHEQRYFANALVKRAALRDGDLLLELRLPEGNKLRVEAGIKTVCRNKR